MTTASTLALCAASSATAAALTALYFRSRLSAARASANLFKDWWLRDSGKMLVAQAELDLIAEQRRSAGRQSHKVEKALFVDTALWLAAQPAQPLRPRAEIEAEVAARRAARNNEILPAAANPASGNPAGAQRPEQEGGTGHRYAGQDTGAGILPDVTPRVASRESPGRSCRRNRAGYSAPADTPKMMKGL